MRSWKYLFFIDSLAMISKFELIFNKFAFHVLNVTLTDMEKNRMLIPAYTKIIKMFYSAMELDAKITFHFFQSSARGWQ